jgi:uncharacterized membrane-anchored protein YitT (DUF2179 family)
LTPRQKYLIREAEDYFFITLGLALMAFGWSVFLLPNQIVTGGVTGISALIYYATGIRVENSYAVINVALLVVALKVLGWRFLTKTIYAIAMLYLMLKWAQDMLTGDDGQLINILGDGQQLLSVILGCTCTGTAMAIVFLNNGSTGGTDIVAAVVNKYFNISLGQALFILDVFIIGSTLFISDLGPLQHRAHMCIFGFCTMAIENFMVDYVMNTRRQSVQFLIFSDRWQEIANAIGTEMDHGVTILDGHGWYTGQRRHVLCILARKREAVQMLRLIKLIDPMAFVSQSDVSAVFGEGFDPIKVKVKKKKEPADPAHQVKGFTSNDGENRAHRKS